MTDYYQKNYREYFDNTITVDPSTFLDPLVKRLKKGASIIDVGCGSGRDMAWLKSRGYQPLGFEGSSGLARLAREASGCNVIEGDFETFDFSSLSVDAILLVTALVHVPYERLATVLKNVAEVLNPGGWILLSLKEGSGVFTDEKGRTVYLWQREELETLVTSLHYEIVETSVSYSAIDTSETIISLLLHSN